MDEKEHDLIRQMTKELQIINEYIEKISVTFTKYIIHREEKNKK